VGVPSGHGVPSDPQTGPPGTQRPRRSGPGVQTSPGWQHADTEQGCPGGMQQLLVAASMQTPPNPLPVSQHALPHSAPGLQQVSPPTHLMFGAQHSPPHAEPFSQHSKPFAMHSPCSSQQLGENPPASQLVGQHTALFETNALPPAAAAVQTITVPRTQTHA
jgi:hypothetical protein